MEDSTRIDLDAYPIWEPQSGETETSFDNFCRYFLPVPNANLTEAYRRYKQEMGVKSTVDDACGSWREQCKRYRWRERHRAYWRHKAQSDLEWRSEQSRRLIELELELAQKMMSKASELLDLPAIAGEDKLKDSAGLLRAASDISRKALGLDGNDLDKAVRVVTSAGLEVSDPVLAEVIAKMGAKK